MKKLIISALIVLALVLAAGFARSLSNSVQPTEKPISKGANDERSQETPTLSTEVILEGLTNPWDIAVISEKEQLITERSGQISIVRDGKKTPLLSVPTIVAVGEGGLTGMTIDPDFTKNGYVYACYNTANDIRLSRWHLNNERTALGEQVDIITGMPNNTTTFPGRHSGCRPRFGADGNLWVGTGDVAVGTHPQDPKSLGGKILRVDRDGKAVQGNLGAPFDSRIFSYGHRNTQGLAMLVRVENGNYGYSTEHGPDVDDEVNKLTSGNFGWDPVPGYNEAVSMTDKKKYPDATESVWKSGRPTIAPAGATILTGKQWKRWDGALAVAMLKGSHVRILELENGSLKKEIEVLNTFGRVRSIVLGPDGALYLTTDQGRGQDKIVRVTPN